MKIYKIFFLIILSVLWSCTDAIDIEQPGELSREDSFVTVGNLDSGLLGLYDIFDLSPEIQFNAVFTDEVRIGVDNGGQGVGNGEHTFLLNASSDAPTQNWIMFHAAVSSANLLIQESLKIEATDQQETFNNILGQIYALRAFANFQLISYFSPDYADDTALGGMLFDFVPTFDEVLSRSTNGEIYSAINSDLDLADELLSDDFSSSFVSKDFVLALRARMAAYREQYDDADLYASQLLDNFSIPNREEYVDIFTDQSDVGVIVKLERSQGDSHDRQANTGSGFGAGWVGANFAFVDGTIDGSPYFEMASSLFEELSENDVRFDVLLNETSLFNNAGDRDTLVVGKYPGDAVPLMNDLKVFRIEEMLLIKAESQIALNNLTEAATLIKELRDARFEEEQELPIFADQTEAFGAILDERRIELAYEGHRWKDLKRLGVRGNRGILRNDEDCGEAINNACSLDPTDFRFTMPIPLSEINANPIVAEQQNDGY